MSGVASMPLARLRRLPWLGVALTLAGAGAALAYGWLALPARPEHMTAREVEERTTAFSREAPLPLQVVRRDEVERALATMDLSADSATRMREDLQAGRQRLAWIAVWDDRDVDGDTITVRSNGYERTVRLPGAPEDMAIPVPVDSAIEVLGTRDGDAGGGITATLRSGTRAWKLPVMHPGETTRVPVMLHVPIR